MEAKLCIGFHSLKSMGVFVPTSNHIDTNGLLPSRMTLNDTRNNGGSYIDWITLIRHYLAPG